MSLHDNLSEMFQRNLRLQHISSTPDQQFMFEEKQHQQQQQTSNATTRIYASQHYTHSTHLQQAQTITTAPQQTRKGYDEDTLATIFHRHDINHDLLSQAQVSLFKMAGYEEQLRLLELWRTAPMTTSDLLSIQSRTTSLTDEENAARLRYERQRDVHTRSDSFDFQEAKDQTEPYIGSGQASQSGMQRSRDPLFHSVVSEGDSRDRRESSRQARDFERLQKLHHLMTDNRHPNDHTNEDDVMEL